MIIGPGWAILLFVVPVVFLGRTPCIKKTMSDFC